MKNVNDIRAGFLDFFAANGHEVRPSSALVPHNDPTLMFTNAGMNQFKNVFTGAETRAYNRAATSQKCVRAGGKHNDLENVGYTARHHTFFEMLGNFSFGDYFKETAIELAWKLLTKEYGLSPEKLTFTVYHTDDEAFNLWKKITGCNDSRILRVPTKDNFWSMGDTGPCGPCSEIFYDHGVGNGEWALNADGSDRFDERFVEIWNLVFMQYEQVDAATRLDLPRPSIDTGMGLERIAAVLQGVHDNYDTDVFKTLIAASEDRTRPADGAEARASHRIIADHLRSSGFLVADGVLPANEGRGYVLRRIMRRAMRHAHLLGSPEPLLHQLVPALVSTMGAAYPELVRAQPLIEETLKLEETRFRQTLERGLGLLDEATGKLAPGATLPGAVAFKLYDTFGFPYDLTEDALRAQGRGVDRAGFDVAMAEQKRAARAAWTGSGARASETVWFDIAEASGATEFIGYTGLAAQGQVVALVKDGVQVQRAEAGDKIDIITNQTPFYGESGGQAGDCGLIAGDAGLRVTVADTSKPLGKLIVHHGTIESGALAVGDTVALAVDGVRRAQLRANHSATHLLHAALRSRLGGHVTQKGSLVAADRLRFDFSQPRALTAEDIAAVEAEVNAQIRGNRPVVTRLMTPDAAIEAGALALFGEKYGEEVRVLSMGGSEEANYSTELCGGTHVSALGDIALFKITGESAVASGVRRIEALTGEAARLHLAEQEARLKAAAATLKVRPDEVAARVEMLTEERKRLERELAEAKKALALAGPATGGGAAAPESVGGAGFIGQVLDGLDAKNLRGLVDEAKKTLGSGVAVLVAVNEGRASVAVGVTDDLLGSRSAVDLVRIASAALGGQGGGGRPDFAQAGGPDGAKAAEAVAAVKAALG